MKREEAQLILAACGPGEPDMLDPQVAAAFAEMERDPELARWFEEERVFDQTMSDHLAAVSAPLGLKTRILANAKPARKDWKLGWAAVIAAGVAAIALLAQLVLVNRSTPKPVATLAEFREEMISFVRVGFTLDMTNPKLEPVQRWLAQQTGSPPAENVPARLAQKETVGCRILSFRGHKVSLVCFWRDKAKDEVAHLFIVDQAALPQMKAEANPRFAKVGGWMTASWIQDGRVYTLALQGDEKTIRKFLPGA
jgi:hypothetical protein